MEFDDEDIGSIIRFIVRVVLLIGLILWLKQ